MSESSTTADTWLPDWDEIICMAVADEPSTWEQDVLRAVKEYQRQAAAAGLVMVRREDAHYLAAIARDICDGLKPLATQELRVASNLMFDAALAATLEPAPGGVGS